MNSIAEIQNHPRQLRRLAAQRVLYFVAKRYNWAQIIGTSVVPPALAFISLYESSLSPYAALFGICFLVFDLTILEKAMSNATGKAAEVQEMFDCDVLQIPRSLIPMGREVTIEEVLEHHDDTSEDGLRDWYPPLVTQFRLPVARLLCQRTNVYWDTRIRTSYSNWLRGLVLAVGLVIILVGMIDQMQLEKVVLILSALSPFIRFSVKQYSANKEASDRLARLATFFATVLHSIKEGVFDDHTLLIHSRRAQDELYLHRSRSPLIPEMMYRMKRDNTESIVNKAIEALADDLIQNKSQL